MLGLLTYRGCGRAHVLLREPVACDGDAIRLRYSLEAMALYAGQGVGRIRDVVPAGLRLHRMVSGAAERLARMADLGERGERQS